MASADAYSSPSSNSSADAWVTFTGTRAEQPPRRFLQIELLFDVHGAVPPDAVERAIALSREKYCSVWHSFRQDIALSTTFQVTP